MRDILDIGGRFQRTHIPRRKPEIVDEAMDDRFSLGIITREENLYEPRSKFRHKKRSTFFRGLFCEALKNVSFLILLASLGSANPPFSRE